MTKSFVTVKYSYFYDGRATHVLTWKITYNREISFTYQYLIIKKAAIPRKNLMKTNVS